VAWTTDDLLAAVQVTAQAPSGGWQFTPAEVFEIAWQETVKRLMPPVRSVREDFWTTTTDYPIAAGVSSTRSPGRAAASTATSFWILPGAGQRPIRLARVPASNRQFYVNAAQGMPTAYCLEGDTVHLLPVPSQAVTLRVQYDRRPSKYVPISECWELTFLPSGLDVITTGPLAASTNYDLVRAEPPCDVLVQGVNASAVGVGTITFTFAADAAPGLEAASVGDYVALAGYTCVPPIPDVLHPVLVDLTAAACCRASGWTNRYALIREDIDSYFPNILQNLAIRVSADPEIVFDVDSPLRVSDYGTTPRGYL
jgi:hypothetical protein